MVKYISPVNILFNSKASLRHLQDMSSRRLQNVFSVTIFCLPRRLEEVFKTSCEMSSRRLQDVFPKIRRKIVTLKTCWRRLQDMTGRRLEDVLKTNRCLLEWYSSFLKKVFVLQKICFKIKKFWKRLKLSLIAT